MNLRTPGPTPCPPEVLAAMGHPMIDHRGPESAALIKRLEAGLKRAFQTDNDILLVTGSGTAGLETAVVNTVSPGEKVLAVSIGNFGDRFAGIAKAYGADVTRLSFADGTAADPAAVAQALNDNPAVTTVLVTHNETSTGVTNPLEAIAKVVKDADKLLLVDAVSSLSSMPVKVDAWGLDVVVSGSQKGWMVPPGAAFVSMSPRAWAAYERCTTPRYYLDAGRHRESQLKGENPWTPALSIFFGLDVAIQMLEAEGWEQVYARHAALAQYTREGAKALGLELLADEAVASNTVTAIWNPEGIDNGKFRRMLHDEYGISVAGGQGGLTGKIFRIGHLGLCTKEDLQEALSGVAQALEKLGYKPKARV